MLNYLEWKHRLPGWCPSVGAWVICPGLSAQFWAVWTRLHCGSKLWRKLKAGLWWSGWALCTWGREGQRIRRFLAQNAEKTYSRAKCIFCVTHHSSLGSGSVLWRDIRSLTYWLNALLLHLQNRYFSNQSYVKRYLNKKDFERLSSDFSN